VHIRQIARTLGVIVRKMSMNRAFCSRCRNWIEGVLKDYELCPECNADGIKQYLGVKNE